MNVAKIAWNVVPKERAKIVSMADSDTIVRSAGEKESVNIPSAVSSAKNARARVCVSMGNKNTLARSVPLLAIPDRPSVNTRDREIRAYSVVVRACASMEGVEVNVKTAMVPAFVSTDDRAPSVKTAEGVAFANMIAVSLSVVCALLWGIFSTLYAAKFVAH